MNVNPELEHSPISGSGSREKAEQSSLLSGSGFGNKTADSALFRAPSRRVRIGARLPDWDIFLAEFPQGSVRSAEAPGSWFKRVPRAHRIA